MKVDANWLQIMLAEPAKLPDLLVIEASWLLLSFCCCCRVLLLLFRPSSRFQCDASWPEAATIYLKYIR